MLATIGTILLFILKIIGILLLCIIGLIILALLIVLFVPLRYKAEGCFDEKIKIDVKFSWLLHLINGTFSLNDKKSNFKVRLIIFQLIPKKEKSITPAVEDKVERSKEESKKTEPTKAESTKIEKQIKIKEDHIKQDNKEHKNKEKVNAKKKDIKKGKEKIRKKNHEKKKNDNKESPFEQVKRIWGFLQEDKNRGVLKHILKYIGRLICWILPKKACANIELGLEDPATTGYITGFASIIYVKTKGNFQITPNFHEQVIKGSFKIRGRLYLYQPIYYIIRIIIDKRVRRMYKLFKEM